MSNGISEKSGIACLLFLLLLQPCGWGIHRFYVGKIGTGILYLLTAGGFGVWWLIDLIMLCVGACTDADGNTVTLSN
ncbi:MAG: TM2 domain-containing protein [Planctomycetota bacterium]|jgi:TM2 domain-containing membrane protein YozV